MMKKFLLLALVLGMVGLANAGLQFSVNGQVAPDEIDLVKSDTIILDITASGGQLGSGFFLDMMGPGLIGVANAVQYVHYTTVAPIVPKPADEFVIDLGNGAGADQTIMLDLLIPGSTPNTLPTGTIVDLMTFHCEGPGTVTLTLWDTNDATVLDILTIHQTPEPMTMLLLGLGGLFLRKR
jgi:hypothetical protein